VPDYRPVRPGNSKIRTSADAGPRRRPPTTTGGGIALRLTVLRLTGAIARRLTGAIARRRGRDPPFLTRIAQRFHGEPVDLPARILEPHAERQTELPRRVVRESVRWRSERRGQIPVHSVHGRGRERVERRQGCRVEGRQDALPGCSTGDRVQLKNAAAGEHRLSAAAQILLVEDVQDLRLDEQRNLARAAADGATASDEAMLVERLGQDVHVVHGSERNIKITRPADMELARFYLQQELAGK